MRTTAEAATGRTWDLAVIGGGPAGCQTAIGAASEGISTLVIEPGEVGGQIRTTPHLENFAGHTHGITGAGLARTLWEQASKFGVRFLSEAARGIRRCEKGMIHVATDAGEIDARAAVIATGAGWRKIDFEGLDECLDSLVFYGPERSAWIDVEDEEAVIVGGGNSAGQAVLKLARTARKVHVIVRSNLKTSRYLTERIERDPAVMVHTGARIRKAEKAGSRCRVEIERDGGRTLEVLARSVMICAGTKPNTGWLGEAAVALDARGFIATDGYRTNVPGVFAVGDVRSGAVRRVTSAIGDGSNIQPDLWEYLEHETVEECAA